MNTQEAATQTLQGLADRTRGRMNAAGEAARQAGHSYAAGHERAGDRFAEDARARLDEAEGMLQRLERLGRGLGRETGQ